MADACFVILKDRWSGLRSSLSHFARLNSHQFVAKAPVETYCLARTTCQRGVHSGPFKLKAKTLKG